MSLGPLLLRAPAISPSAPIRRAADPLAHLIANLWAGLRLALFLPVQRDRFWLSADQAVLLLLVSLAVQIAGGVLGIAPVSALSSAGLTAFGIGSLLLIFGCYLVTRLQRAPLGIGALLALICSWGPYASVAAMLIWLAPRHLQLALYVSVTAWGIAALVRSIRLMYGKGIWRGLASAGILVVCSIASQAVISLDTLRYTEYGANYRASEAIDAERTFYAQPHLVDGAVAALRPQRTGVVDLYFVGFAGYAHQDVFLREVRSVGELFARRFDTNGRSVLLINNPQTTEELPLANAHNLASVLEAVAARMDPDEDILFLFLTSHGSPDLLAVDFWPLPLNGLWADDLDAMLDGSGIRNRVVVVSACYSGSFIDVLKDENSLIMTASRHDRSSFGCSHEREFTYFGEAYFDQALRTERSFVKAFETAARTIEARERDEGLTPSMPQIFVGDAIQTRLDALERRLESRGEMVAAD